ncbi:UNVERIFIED_ORG: hypothetical protein E4P37_00640 [Bacillus sp. AZ43]
MTGLAVRPRDDLRRLALLAALGLLAGVAAKVADESGRLWAADLGSDPAAWVLAVALIGWSAPTAVLAAVRAAAFFAAMTVAYYGWAAWVLDFGTDRDLVVIWLLLSATAVPAFSAVVRWSTRRPGPLAGALAALAASTALLGGTVRRLGESEAVVLGLEKPVQALVEAVVVLVVALVLPRHHSTRIWAAVLVLPVWWLLRSVLGGTAFSG